MMLKREKLHHSKNWIDLDLYQKYIYLSGIDTDTSFQSTRLKLKKKKLYCIVDLFDQAHLTNNKLKCKHIKWSQQNER